MGREAICTAHCGSEADEVKALLEAHELILRGPIRRRFAIAGITDVAVDGDGLVFRSGGECVTLDLGATEAARWAARILAPPPSLADKLGIAPDRPAWRIGSAADPELAAAFAGATVDDPAAAATVIAIVDDADDLDAARTAAEAQAPGLPLWIVHGKGKAAALGGDAVRAAMRAAGYIDTKISGVSESRSATRYVRRAS